MGEIMYSRFVRGRAVRLSSNIRGRREYAVHDLSFDRLFLGLGARAETPAYQDVPH